MKRKVTETEQELKEKFWEVLDDFREAYIEFDKTNKALLDHRLWIKQRIELYEHTTPYKFKVEYVDKYFDAINEKDRIYCYITMEYSSFHLRVHFTF